MMEDDKKNHCYQYPRPALTIDCCVLRPGPSGYELLLIQRGREPYKGRWAFPGGFFDMEDESVEYTAARELMEETGLKVDLHLLGPFSAKNRDPRERTVTLVYWGLADADMDATAGDDADSADWFPLASLPPLAFDHGLISERLRQRLADHLAQAEARH